MTSNPSTSQTEVLRTEGLTKFFGGLCAVQDFDIQVPEGALHGLIGPNGAGKTTVFNMVTGLYAATEGDVCFMGQQNALGPCSGPVADIFAGQ